MRVEGFWLRAKRTAAITTATALRKKPFWKQDMGPPKSSASLTNIPIAAKPNAEAIKHSVPFVRLDRTPFLR